MPRYIAHLHISLFLELMCKMHHQRLVVFWQMTLRRECHRNRRGAFPVSFPRYESEGQPCYQPLEERKQRNMFMSKCTRVSDVTGSKEHLSGID